MKRLSYKALDKIIAQGKRKKKSSKKSGVSKALSSIFKIAKKALGQ